MTLVPTTTGQLSAPSTSTAPTPGPAAPASNQGPQTDEEHETFADGFGDAFGYDYHHVPNVDPPTPALVPVSEPLPNRVEPEIKTPESNVTVGPEKPSLALLFEILSYRRGHDSAGERAFVSEVLLPFLEKTEGCDYTFKGPFGVAATQNIVVFVPNADGSQSETLFSCHIDTMHSSSDNTIRQKLDIDIQLDHVFLRKGQTGCLGADDGGGVWLMMQMIRFGKPGVYVFHRGEERSCIGSNWMRSNEAEFLRKFKRAIAFDRKDESNVITHQRDQRCCSQEFAAELAKRLSNSKFSLKYEPDHTGMYTDTANYTSLIPECTNISIGYMDAHGVSESLNYHHLDQLFGACYNLDWDSLPTARNPKIISYDSYQSGRSYGGNHGYGSGYGNGHGHSHVHGYGGSPSPSHAPPAPAPTPAGGKKNKKNKNTRPFTDTSGRINLAMEFSQSDLAELTFVELIDLVEQLDSETVAYMLAQLIEECDGWKARLRTQRRLAGFSN